MTQRHSGQAPSYMTVNLSRRLNGSLSSGAVMSCGVSKMDCPLVASVVAPAFAAGHKKASVGGHFIEARTFWSPFVAQPCQPRCPRGIQTRVENRARIKDFLQSLLHPVQLLVKACV